MMMTDDTPCRCEFKRRRGRRKLQQHENVYVGGYDGGDDSENVTIEMNQRFLTFQGFTQAYFPEVKFLGTAPTFRKKKKDFVVVCLRCPKKVA